MSTADVAADSQSEVAEAIAELFAEAFTLDTVDVDDDFFQLGGDSLIGQSLMTAIEQRWAVALSLSVLLQASTPRSLAATLAKHGTEQVVRCLIPVNDKGTPPAIFYVHGTDGESVAPVRLSEQLPSRPFYAFRALGLQEGEPFLRTADAIAGRYAAEIEKSYAGVPRIILGHCAGAAIAYELAQQLAAAGTPIMGMILIDPEVGREWAPFLYATGLQLSLMRGMWAPRAAELDEMIAKRSVPTSEQRRKIVSAGLRYAAAMYSPLPYAGPTLLISSPERKADLTNGRFGYPALVKDLTVAELSVVHERMFDDGLPEVVSAVESFLARLGAKP
jgi:thioesterase domain-containing protein/acyl carrier protein